MPRRNKIEINRDSILVLMQEIYNELVENRASANKILKKLTKMLEDPDELHMISPLIKDQQKIINDCIEKKLSLSKLQNSIWEKDLKNSPEEEDFDLSDLAEDDELDDLIDDIDKRNKVKYKV